MTATIQIGNSDNKLTQEEWAKFCSLNYDAIRLYVKHVHFRCGSSYDSKWQNACFVVEIEEENIRGLRVDLFELKHDFKQDAIAVTFGETIFV